MTITTPVPADNELLQQRRIQISKSETITGLDYIKYVDTGSTGKLELHFIEKASDVSGVMIPSMTQANIQITVKTPGTDNAVFAISTFSVGNNSVNSVYSIDLSGSTFNASDNTIYTLSLIESNDVDSNGNVIPLSGVDPFLFQADFSISSSSQTQIDGLQPIVTDTAFIGPAPEIDYLSRDYLSFRQLMLGRLSTLIPDWQANNEADLGSVIIEVLAYVADYLSYYQDAVATEAYLGTARSRVSVRRHARLLDYVVSEGCNARVWVHVDLAKSVPSLTLPRQTLLFSRSSIAPGAIALDSDIYQTLSNDPAVIPFATLYPITLYPTHNQIDFYTWGSQEFSLAVGATSATLLGKLTNLQPGDVLIFAQVKSTDAETPDSVDSTLRWAVRLETVGFGSDPLFSESITKISWNAQDALPFELVIASIINGVPVTGVSQAYGNMVLADQGQFIRNDPLLPKVVPAQGTYRPTLSHKNITFYESFSNTTAIQQGHGASQATQQNPRAAVPYITLTDTANQLWNAKQDLLDSNHLSTDFVLETDDSQQAFIRFGDGTLGKLPNPGDTFRANYRISNGSAGNIGADSLAYIAVDATSATTILGVSNPLPAQGGTDPEPIEQVKFYAPKAFQKLERCVTVEDYIQVTQQYDYINQTTGQDNNINSVNAILRWTGSWNTVFIAVALKGGADFDDNFRQGLLDYLATYQLMHQDLEIISPQWVPLTITLPITVQQGYSENVVQQNLMQRFSSTIPSGFFYPDNFKFGQSIYLSDIIVAVMETPGVAFVDIASKDAQFQRFGQDALTTQKIDIGALEIARVNPNVPGQGSIKFIMTTESTSCMM